MPVWSLAREIVNDVYSITNSNPKLEKDFRLSSQLIGAAVSIMNNIAEGFDAGSNSEFIRFLKYSQKESKSKDL